jgi:hypothetical protein
MKKAFIILVLVLTSMTSIAKREPPKQVDPLEYKGIIYQTLPWAAENGTNQNGGFIQVIEKDTNKVLWQLQVYKTKYLSTMERDVQDVFITGLKIDKNNEMLLVQSEDDLMHKVSLVSRRVIGVKLNT